jgi:hypothetical protein
MHRQLARIFQTSRRYICIKENENYKQLIASIAENNIKKIKYLVSIGIDLNSRQTTGCITDTNYSAIELCVRYGNYEMFDYLINDNNNVDLFGHLFGTTLGCYQTQICDKSEYLKKLHSNQLVILQSMIKNNKNFYSNIRDKKIQCVINNRLDILKILSDDYNDDTEMFMLAVQHNKTSIAKFYANRNRNRNANINISTKVYHTLINCAINNSNAKILDILMSIQCNIELEQTYIKNNLLILHESIKKNNLKMITCLLKYGANPNENNGEIIIHCCENGYVAALLQLIKYGANIRIQNDILLATAINNDYKVCTNLLLKYGANYDNCKKFHKILHVFDISKYNPENQDYENISKELNEKESMEIIDRLEEYHFDMCDKY